MGERIARLRTLIEASELWVRRRARGCVQFVSVARRQLDLATPAAGDDGRTVVLSIDSMRSVCIEMPRTVSGKSAHVRGAAASLKSILSFGSATRAGQRAIRSDVDDTLDRLADDTVDAVDVDTTGESGSVKEFIAGEEEHADGKPHHRRGGAVEGGGQRLSQVAGLGLDLPLLVPMSARAVPVPEWQRLMRNMNVRATSTARMRAGIQPRACRRTTLSLRRSRLCEAPGHRSERSCCI